MQSDLYGSSNLAALSAQKAQGQQSVPETALQLFALAAQMHMSCLESQVSPRCLSAEICPRETPCAQ